MKIHAATLMLTLFLCISLVTVPSALADCSIQCIDLIAGGGNFAWKEDSNSWTDVGSIAIEVNDCNGQTLLVTYHTDGNWRLLELHLHVVCDENIGPEAFAAVLTNDGVPIPGKFDYKVEGINTNEYTISVEVDVECSRYLIAAHAVVFNSCSQIEETAWGTCLEEPLSFVKLENQNNWALYFAYPDCCQPDDGCGDEVDDGCGDEVDDGCGDEVDDGCGDEVDELGGDVVDELGGDVVDELGGDVVDELGGDVEDEDGEDDCDVDSLDDTISLLGVANISLGSLIALILTLLILTTLGAYHYKRSRMIVKLAK